MSESGNTTAAAQAFAFPIRVYWEDTDAGGIVFYANHLKFFERARTEWLRALGIEQHTLREQAGGMFVVSETQLKYHRPARLDDRLLVTATVEQMGRVALVMKQTSLLIPQHLAAVRELSPAEQLHIMQTAPLLCEGSIRIGWVDETSLRPARIPQHVLDAMAGSC